MAVSIKHDAFDLVESDFIVGAVAELAGFRGAVCEA
jgi:hypothetical protein